ncbi:hypothetical protein WMF30_10225 [Sorangium sp. So ce134]
MTDPSVFYFGDPRLEPGPGAGHHLWAPAYGYVGWARLEEQRKLPWGLAELDGRLAGHPALADPRERGWWASKDQPEGIVRLHHRGGWTAISFWDRSGDGRHGSSSTFVAAGEHTAREMVELFQRSFPALWARVTRRFQLVLPVEAARPEPAPRLRIEAPAIRVAAETGDRLEIADVATEEDGTAESATGRRAAVVDSARRSG